MANNSLGIATSHFNQMSLIERIRLENAIEKFATDFEIVYERRPSEDGTLWFECDDPRLGSMIVGFMMALGFDEYGKRHVG